MKICTECGLEKPLDEFNKNKSKKDGLQQRCRSCDNERAKTYYAANAERMKKQIGVRNKRLRNEAQEWVCVYLDTHPCVDCGETDILVLEFDHLKDKELSISNMCLRGWSVDKIKQEITKCEVVCANDHRRRTARRGNHFRHARSNPVG